MSVFSDKLKEIIDANHIKVYRLAQSAGVDRSTVHKIISSKRAPADAFVKKLISAMPIPTMEQDMLLHLFEVSKCGEFVYNQRLQVKGVIDKIGAVCDMPKIEPLEVPDVSIGWRNPAEKDPVEIVYGELMVSRRIDDVLASELGNYAAPKVSFFMPCSYSFFFENLFVKFSKNPEFKIECLFEFSNSEAEGHNPNLEVMSAILPFIMQGRDSFSAYYLYLKNLHTDMTTMPLSYYIVTSDCAVAISSDLQTAIVYNKAELVDFYAHVFENSKGRSQPLVKNSTTIEDMVKRYNEGVGSESLALSGFGAHPCLSVYFDKALMDAHVSPYVPERDAMIAQTVEVYGFMRQIKSKQAISSYFTLKGFDYFVEMGILQTYPVVFFKAFSVEERIALIEHMITDTENDTMIYRVINTSRLKVPEYIYVDVFRESNIDIVIADKAGQRDAITVKIPEYSIVDAFYDFLVYAVDTDMVYSKADTLRVLAEALEKLKELTNKPQ